MFRQDWLMQQIEMAARVLAAIVGKARAGQPLEALGMFDQAYQPLLGVSARLLPVLPDQQLLERLAPGGVPDADRWPFLVRLLITEADLYVTLGDPEQAHARYRRAARIADELGGDRSPDPELDADVATRLRGTDPDAELRVVAARLLERAGRFADAEDTLFDAIDELDAADGERGLGDQTRDGEALVDAAIAMYLRLLAKGDRELAAGNLPRDEVNQSLAELLTRTPRT
jgi:tetratricopeptide (TPR) repeat protein